LAQRSARREARSRAEADAGHRKRALLPFPDWETKRAFSTQSPILLPYIKQTARLAAGLFAFSDLQT
jgi:hypothetical protein